MPLASPWRSKAIRLATRHEVLRTLGHRLRILADRGREPGIAQGAARS